MNKVLLSILFSLIYCVSIAQTLSISGRAVDEENPSAKIYALKVKVHINNSLFSETICDSNGYYAINIPGEILDTLRLKITIYQDQVLLTKLFPKPADCPYWYQRPARYFANGERIIIPTAKIKYYKADFSLTKMMESYRIPCISFKKNTVELSKCENYSPDTTLTCLRNFMINNPAIIIKLVGHSWDESGGKKLSSKRAKYIKQTLHSYGIDKSRIVAVGMGDTQPLIKKEVIDSTKNDLEKEALIATNIRLEFFILSWDYDPILKKRKEKQASPRTISNDEDEY